MWESRTENLEESTDRISEPTRRIRVSRPYCRNISAQGSRSKDRTVRDVISTKMKMSKGLRAPIGEGTVKSGVGHPETASNHHTSGFLSVRIYMLHLKIRDSSQRRT